MRRKIILFLAIGVFLFSSFKLFQIFREYQKGKVEYEKVKEAVVNHRDDEQKESEQLSSDDTATDYQIDFDKLKEINEDTVAWIRFDNPKIINYPVLQGEDNDTYLHTTIEGQDNSAGAIFMDMNNNSDFSDENTLIHGHNMKNGSMFGKLKEYRSEKYWKKNPYFYIYTPDQRVQTYQIFAVLLVEYDDDIYQIQFFDESNYDSFLQDIEKRSLYDTGISVNTQDKIVTLSTCTGTSQKERLVVLGVAIDTKAVE